MRLDTKKSEDKYLKGLSIYGLALYTFMKEKKITKEEIAKELGITLEALNYKMRGKNGGFRKLEVFYLDNLMLSV